MSNDDNFTTNRRRFLSTLGAVGLATTGVQTAAATGPDRVQVRLGNLDSPVSAQEKTGARRRAFEAFQAEGGRFDSPLGGAEREGSDDEELVGYLATVTNNGQFQEFVAHASNPADTERARNRIREAAAERRQAVSSTTVTSDDLSTQSASWDWFYGHTSWARTDPYGEVENTTELIHLLDDGRSDYEAFISPHEVIATPGYQEFDSDYRVNQMWSEQDWDTCDILYRTDDFEPSNDHTGSKTVDVDVSPDPEYSYSFDLGDGTMSKTSTQNQQSNGYGEWNGNYSGYYSAQQNEQTIMPSSSAWVYDKSSGTYDLDKTSSVAEFEIHEDNYYNAEKITETKTMQVEFTSDGPMGDTK